MIIIKTLEIHASHSCNLSCKGCTHYSDNNLKGMLSVAEAEAWMIPWSTRIKPKQFVILGGEPTLNKNLTEICIISRKYWPHSDVFVVSNGFFINKHPNLQQAMIDNHIRLEISIHGDSQKYRTKIKEIREYLSTWKIPITWRTCYEKWLMMYDGYGHTMKPFEDGDPKQSWDICLCKYCNQLFEGKIWKCPNIAYLQMQLKKQNLESSEAWKKYLEYQPLSPDCTHEELVNFWERKEESICNMCPKNEHPISNQEKNPLSLPIITI